MSLRTKSWGPGANSETSVHQIYDVPTSTWNDDYSQPFTTTIESGGFEGHDLPGFHKLRREGALIPATRWKRWTLSGAAGGQYGPNTYPPGGSGPVRHFPFGIWQPPGVKDNWLLSEPALLAYADGLDADYYLQAAASRIYSRGWDALTFLSEFHKTVAMFKGFRKRLFKAIARGRVDKLWLEGRYGWRILWYDIQDIQKAIENVDSGRKRFKERVGATFAGSDTTSWDGGRLTTIIANVGYTMTTDWSVSVRGGIVADIEPPKIAMNPVTTGWELITFSFVIDWFVNVGQWLEAMSFLALQTNHTAWTGYKINASRTVEVTNVTFDNGGSGTVAGEGHSEMELLLRMPGSVSKTPRVSVRVDSGKLVDLAALGRARGRR